MNFNEQSILIDVANFATQTIERQQGTSILAACYCRLSKDDEQDGSSISIETQSNILSDYCKANGFQIFDFYCDDGFTGTNFDRPEFKRMMSDAESGKINTIVVKDLSRLGRNYIETGRLIEETFPEKGVRFIALGDNVDTDSEGLDLDFMLPLKNIFNQFYPADCSRKTRQALHSKALKGEFIGTNAPYGYKKSVADKHVLEIDKDTAPTVKRIFEMAAYEGYGYNKISNILRNEKILTPTAYIAKCSGKSYDKEPYVWNLTTIRIMLENQVYLGHTVNCKKRKISFKSKRVVKQSEDKWIVVENTHEPIVSQKLWNVAHDKLSMRKRECKNGETQLFAGIARCDKCGYTLSLSTVRNREKFYCCNTYKKRGKEACTIHYIRYDDLYDVVLNDIQRHIFMIQNNEEKFSKQLLKRLGKVKSSDTEKLKSDIKASEKRIKELDDRFYKLYEDKLDSFLSEEQFKELSRRFEAEKNELKSKLEVMKHKSDTQEETVQNVDAFIAEIKWLSEVSVLTKEVLHRLIDKITVGNKEIIDGVKTQEIRIFYKFVGSID